MKVLFRNLRIKDLSKAGASAQTGHDVKKN